MYTLTLNTTYILLNYGHIPDVAEFSLERLCPYMKQPIKVYLTPPEGQLPVLSWLMAKQLSNCRERYPELNSFRIIPIGEEEDWPIPRRIESLEQVKPGRLILLTASMYRGLGDMILMLPILRGFSERLSAMGWSPRFGLTAAIEFAALLSGQPFLQQFLPECPVMDQISPYDYAIEFGLNLERMKSFLGIQNWRDIDLRVRLNAPEKWVRKWQKRISSTRLRVFINWRSLDRQRSLTPSFFEDLLRAFPECDFFTSQLEVFNNEHPLPDGITNLTDSGSSLADLIGKLANMDIVITTNTGIAHLAAALEKPTIVLFTGRLYGWEHYWPDLYKHLYPSMHAIGLDEGLQLQEAELLTRLHKTMADIL